MNGAHDDVPAGVAVTPPVEDHLVSKGIAVVGHGEVAVLVEALDGQLGAAFAQRGGDRALLEISLAAVFAELDHGDPLAKGCEQSARLDRRELLRIADKHDLRVRSVGFLGERGEHASAKHPGFVDHKDVALAKPHAPRPDRRMERVGRRRGDPRSGFELACCPCGE